MTAALSAAHRARKFLLAGQQPLGWWSDFRLAPGASTLWVTAYVGAALARSGGRDAAMRAWRFLRRWVAGGWGYSQATPPDADSTAWCLGLAAMLEWRQDPLVEDARRFLTSCTRSDGGLATYPCNDDIRCFVGAGAADSFAGWQGSCLCVTAAAARLGVAGTGACDFIARAQRPDGSWASYWWVEDEYATVMAALALMRRGTPADMRAVSCAANWAAARVGGNGAVPSSVLPEGSAFATALVLELLAACPADAPAARRAVTWLHDRQEPDGRWPPSAGLRVPAPGVTAPDAHSGWRMGGMREGSVALDICGAFTAATAMSALSAWAAHSSAQPVLIDFVP
ncbi:MAG: hypothetical protein KBG46_00985 [Paracoccus sp.]|nr:hypothetical protein [Paracoccus sp. (in: a-proteobacteria)]